MDNYQYQQYLKSDEWKQKARQRAEIDDFKCCMCGATGTMNNPLEIQSICCVCWMIYGNKKI